jgi:phosphoribosyl 1,2-cyclic phosphodiesterase
VHLQVLGSGSGGNSVLVRAGELNCLVDAGLPIDELERRLAEAHVPPHRLDAIALTHGHLDHARAAGLLSSKTGARVYCSEGLMSNASLRRARAFHALPVGGSVTIRARRGADELCLHAVPLPHDADPTLAFRLEHGGRTAAVCTDMGHPERAAAQALAGAHMLVLEFNHDAEMLARGPYTSALKRRVAGPRGHLSNAEAAEVLRWALAPELATLVLAHLSATNNRPELALECARAALTEAGRADVRCLVAEQERIGPLLEV